MARSSEAGTCPKSARGSCSRCAGTWSRGPTLLRQAEPTPRAVPRAIRDAARPAGGCGHRRQQSSLSGVFWTGWRKFRLGGNGHRLRSGVPFCSSGKDPGRRNAHPGRQGNGGTRHGNVSWYIAGAEEPSRRRGRRRAGPTPTSDEASSPEMRRRHLRDLFQLVVKCLHDGVVEPIIASSQQLAADRFAAGFDISEVQGEFNVLEEVLWREVAATLAGDQRIEALELLNATLGQAGTRSPEPTWPSPWALAVPGTSSRSRRAKWRVRWRGLRRRRRAQSLLGGNIETEVMGRVGVITLGDQHRRNRHQRGPGERCRRRAREPADRGCPRGRAPCGDGDARVVVWPGHNRTSPAAHATHWLTTTPSRS